MAKKILAKAGSLLLIDGGSLLKYEIKGLYLVLKQFNPLQEIARLREDNQFMTYEECIDKIIEQGMLMLVNYGNLYLGNGCDVPISFDT